MSSLIALTVLMYLVLKSSSIREHKFLNPFINFKFHTINCKKYFVKVTLSPLWIYLWYSLGIDFCRALYVFSLFIN